MFDYNFTIEISHCEFYKILVSQQGIKIMKINKSLIRQSHFLGTKIRNLRKRNNLTMDDLSARCIRIDPESAPSVSYLSMIERGKRVPSLNMLEVIAEVFQKAPEWFLDDEPGNEDLSPVKAATQGGVSGMPLEPAFCFPMTFCKLPSPNCFHRPVCPVVSLRSC